VPNDAKILDLFSGTSRVGLALKEKGFLVAANDHNEYAYHLARCYIETDLGDIPKSFFSLLEELNKIPPSPGYFTENFCVKAKFFHPKNGERVDAIRDYIEKIDLEPRLKSVALVSLMEAADRVDSTCGIQMAYLKDWAKRSYNSMSLRMPKLVERKHEQRGQAFCSEALLASGNIECDVAYLDPPYNQHSYRGNYHIWETLVRWDQPELYGKAQKRIDCQSLKSNFNSKRKFYDSLSAVLKNLKAKYTVLSFNDEGFVSKDDLEQMLKEFGEVKIYNVEYKRYVGAQIGIYNQKGEKVGKVK
jgi:adenine-specific DNA-methyltransferase